MAENEVMDMAIDDVEISDCGGSKLDTATTIFCVTGSAIAIGGFVKKYGKKLWDVGPGKLFKKKDKVEESEEN